MKTRFEIIVDANLSDVWENFVDPNKRARWRQNFQSYKQISGTAGQCASVAEVAYIEKGRHRMLIETITERRDESFLAATYTSDQGASLIVNKFEAVGENQSRWTSWSNYRFHGIAKVTALFTVGATKDRMEGDMQRFKIWLETDMAEENH